RRARARHAGRAARIARSDRPAVHHRAVLGADGDAGVLIAGGDRSPTSSARTRTAGRGRGVHGSGAEGRMMSALSPAAWAAHDVGLATAVGGTLYGRAALEPALHEIADPIERDRVSTAAWQKFSWINLVAHGVVAATWFAGRSMLSGREVSGPARSMT